MLQYIMLFYPFSLFLIDVLLVVGPIVAAYCQETTKAKKEAKNNNIIKKKQQTKEPRRQKLQKQKQEKTQLSYETLLLSFYSF